MAGQNIDKFNLYVATVLTNLYETFPVRQDLDPWSLAGVELSEASMSQGRFTGVVEHDGRTVDVGTTDASFVNDTIQWLVDTGFIICSPRDPSRFEFPGATLSMRGLELLKAMPSSIEGERASLGDTLRNLLAEGATQAASKEISTALTKAPWVLWKIVSMTSMT